ncbi:MAG: response regulator [Burkholderiales bacterium]|nr:response regulator [Phycisphaerae bacterium]
MILIIDDASDLRAMLQVLLVHEGYQVAGAASAEEGLMLAAAKKPDLVLLDLCMPGMDGFGFVRSIRKTETLKDVKVVVLSGVDDTGVMHKAHSLGVSEFFVKGTFEIEHLLGRVKFHAGPPPGPTRAHLSNHATV